MNLLFNVDLQSLNTLPFSCQKAWEERHLNKMSDANETIVKHPE